MKSWCIIRTIEKIAQWNFLNKKLYNKNIKKNRIKKTLIQNIYRDIPLQIESNVNKKMIIRSLKYVPYTLFCFIRCIPMPWELNKDTFVFKHMSTFFLIPTNKFYTFKFLFLSQWSFIWIMTKRQTIFKKEKNIGTFFSKKSNFYEKINLYKSRNHVKILNGNLILAFVINSWFCTCNLYFYMKKMFKRFFFVDNLVYTVLFYFLLKGKLFLSFFRDNKNVNFFIKFYFALKTYNQYNHTIFNWTYFDMKKKFINRSYKLDYPFLYNITRSYMVFLYQVKKNINFDIEIKYQKKMISKLFLPRVDSKNIIYFFSKFINLKKEKWFIRPFFESIFLNEREFHLYKKSQSKLNKVPFEHKIEAIYKFSLIELFSINEKIYFYNMNSIFDYMIILKNYSKKISRKTCKRKINRFSFSKFIRRSAYFFKYNTDWTQIGFYICTQSHKMMNFLLGRKNISFLYLDFNFNLKANRNLTTKERKKSRFSNSFHFCREMLRFVKIIVDIYIKFKNKIINEYELLDGIGYIFSHVNHLTGIHRYKYKVIYQIRICKSIKRILYQKNTKNTGFGFWAPFWRIWLFFMKGTFPLLQKWLSNLLSRYFLGRKKNKTIVITNQRLYTYFDIEMKIIFFKELKNQNTNQFLLKNIFEYVKNLWKCWKANIPFKEKNFSLEITNLIFKYLKIKSEWYINTTFLERERMKKNFHIDKSFIKKNMARVTRIWFKFEQNRQINYIKDNYSVNFFETLNISNTLIKWLSFVKFRQISLPMFNQKNEIKILVITIRYLQEIFYSKTKYNQEKINYFFSNFYLVLRLIKQKILENVNFSEIGFSFNDNLYCLIQVYLVKIEDQLVDIFIDQYLWLEITKQFLIPFWIKPSDFEINPFSAYKFSFSFYQEIIKKNVIKNFLIHAKFVEFYENINLITTKKILIYIIDQNIINYIAIRNNCRIFYKDMVYTNCVGLIKGIIFNGLLFQLYSTILDLFILGLKKIKYVYLKKYVKKKDNIVLKYRKKIFFYSRYIAKIFFVVKSLKHNLNQSDIKHFVFSKLFSLNLNRLVIKYRSRNMNHLKLIKTNFVTSLCGFYIFFQDRFFKTYKIFWFFFYLDKNNLFLLPFMSNFSIKRFESKCIYLINLYNSISFIKMSNKWNLNILGFVSYFRESSKNTIKFFFLNTFLENKLHIKIKISLNSRTISRFPSIVFYTPREFGGLGILSIIKTFLSHEDLKYDLKRKKISNLLQSTTVPCLLDYLENWNYEFKISHETWEKYMLRKFYNFVNRRSLLFEHIRDLWNKGLPRINTLFFTDKFIFSYDRGWRIRSELKKYYCIKKNYFWWTNTKHEGKLWNLNKYKSDLIKTLGGIENILEHTLFKSTYLFTWEKFFWEKVSNLKNLSKRTNLNANQLSGFNRIPNRRFVFWWSSTINRQSVFVGFRSQIELTNIFMYGKIFTLKISFIEIFRSYLWQKIHENIILDILKKLDVCISHFFVRNIQKEMIHPKKSYANSFSCADIILYPVSSWKIQRPCLLGNIDTTYFLGDYSDAFWLDLKLKWNNFDSHDIERASRVDFLSYTKNTKSIYPSKIGAIISIDLAYNIFSGYGYWFNNFNIFLHGMISRIMISNFSLHILRERIKKSLKFHDQDIKFVSYDLGRIEDLIKENHWLFDNTCIYRVALSYSRRGNWITKPVNGNLFFFLPYIGTLFVKIIFKNDWRKKKYLSRKIQLKSVEEIIKLVHYFPIKRRPVELVVSTKSTLSLIRTYMARFSYIKVKKNFFKIPLESLVKYTKMKNLLDCSKFNGFFMFNLYDNWLKSISSFTAFCRLILILKSFKINNIKTKKILSSYEKHQLDNFFWPDLSDKEWIEVEILLRDLILDNYCFHTNISVKNLSQSEIKKIIFEPNLDLLRNSNQDLRAKQRRSFYSDNIPHKTGMLIGDFSVHAGFKKYVFLFPKYMDIREPYKFKKMHFSKLSKNFLVFISSDVLDYLTKISYFSYKVICLIYGFFENQTGKIYKSKIFIVLPHISYHLSLNFKIKHIKHNFPKYMKLLGLLLCNFNKFLHSAKKMPKLKNFNVFLNRRSFFLLALVNINAITYKLLKFQIKYFKDKKNILNEMKIRIYICRNFSTH
nr:splicing factor Prp8 [Cryptomonas paramecium]